MQGAAVPFAAMDFTPSAKSTDHIQRVRRFIQDHIAPVEHRYWDEVAALNPTGDWRTWKIHPLVEELKGKARQAGLWNMFLPGTPGGLSVLDYAPVAEEMGRSFLAP
jgi:alkylation response protein AidB-like acyl-CoA dehydrogenase